MPVICVEQLTKNFKVLQKGAGLSNSLKSFWKREYKTINAVKNINFSIQGGEIVGLIGLNGAGKTTTLKMLSGLVYPTAGSTRVLGYNPWKKERELLKSIGFLMGNKGQLWWDLPAIDSFYLEAEIYDIAKEDLKKGLNNLLTYWMWAVF